jgi:hypothetical protein
MAPIGAGLIVLIPFFVSLSAFPEIVFSLASTLVWGIGIVEAINAYLVIANARALSVRRTRTFMHTGFVLLVAQFAFLVVPDTASRAFSTKIPFPQAFEWVGYGAILFSSFSLAGASWIVCDRWSQIGSDELEVQNWTRASWHTWAFISGMATGTIGIPLDPRFPGVSLILFFAGALLLFAGILPRKTKEIQLTRGSETQPKVELRKVTYEEKLAVGKRACELILHKYGKRRVFAVCMWGDKVENSQPYFGVNLLVVVRDGIHIPAQHYLFDGIEVNITYWQEISILYRARIFDEEWPWRSGSYRTRIVLHEKKGWSRKLDRAVHESDLADPTSAVRESAMLLLEHLAKLRDYRLQNDLVGEKDECRRIAWGAIELILLLNRRYVQYDYWKEVFECSIQTSDLRRQLETLLELTDKPVDIMVETAEKLCEEMFDMVRSRGISLVSSDLKV